MATAEWDLVHPDATGAFVEFGPAGVRERMARARIDDSGHARAFLVGMKPTTENNWRVIEVVGGERLRGHRHALETGSLGTSVPDLTVEIHDPLRASGGYVVTSTLSQPSTAIIVDADGDVVWAHRPSADWHQLHIPRVLRSRTGDWIVYHAGLGYQPGETEVVLDRMIVRIGLDGTGEETLRVPDAHHDVFERGGGGYTVLMYDWRTIDDQQIQGDRLVEIDLDGTQRQIWSVWDHFEYDPQNGSTADLDWSHANAVDYDRGDDAYLVSLHNLDCIVKIDRETGDQLWVLGGEHSTFQLPDGGTTLFQRQHEFELLDDGGIVVFDNGLPAGGDSRVVEYALDEQGGAAVFRWEYRLDPPRYNVALGHVDRLPNGNTLITWSALGQIDEVTPEGTVVWRLKAEMGSGFGYTTWRETLFDVFFDDPLESP